MGTAGDHNAANSVPSPSPADVQSASPADGVLDNTLELARRRAAASQPRAHDRVVTALMGGVQVAAAVAMALCTTSMSGRQWVAAAALVVLYASSYRVAFEATHGSAAPSESVLVAALFMVPVTMAPLVILAGLQLIGLGYLRRPHRLHGFLLRAASGMQALGPALVLWWRGIESPDVRHWPWYLAALAAQFAIDAAMLAMRTMVLKLAWKDLPRLLVWTFGMDTATGAVGLAAVAATGARLTALPFVAAPLAFAWLVARDRKRQVDAAIELGQAVVEARDQARVDTLTGVANRRAWHEEVQRAQAELDAGWGTRVALVAMADVDRLKAVNDSLGHVVGDALIAATAKALRAAAPDDALVARLGGDEFGVLWVTTRDEYDLDGFADRLSAGLGAATLDGVEELASLGTASCPAAATVTDAIELADQALMVAKARRRDAVADPSDV